MNSRIGRDNFFKMVSLNLFVTIWNNLIKSNEFHNHIFIYYRNNHKYNIGKIINHKYKFEQSYYLFIIGANINSKYKFCLTKMKIIQFFSETQKAS